jgi:hypothetical protein
VNFHLYRNVSGTLPIPVTVIASLKKNSGSSAVLLATTNIQLRVENHEITAFRFQLSERSGLVPGSIHTLPKLLRSAVR